MPEISFCFQGWAITNLDTAYDVDGNTVDVSQLCGEVLAAKLEQSELFISLGDHLYTSRKSEVEITDFQGEPEPTVLDDIVDALEEK
jgi:hypothetical protein